MDSIEELEEIQLDISHIPECRNCGMECQSQKSYCKKCFEENIYWYKKYIIFTTGFLISSISVTIFGRYLSSGTILSFGFSGGLILSNLNF